ncbi:MAG: M48 family metallopeptidase [Candidatus Diapherotrites archaeon]|nr:M48 family metallopeptidase [Candidatus Diapherotrites archaeon]
MVMDFYAQISQNKHMTYLLFILFFILIGFLATILSILLGGFNVFGLTYLSGFGIFIILFALISYYTCDSMVTAISGAKEAKQDDPRFKQLHNIVEELCLASGLPKPRVFFIEDTAINAFATGRDPNHSVVCVTTGCLTRLNREEQQGVIAHELSHIRNYDIRTMTIASVLVGIAVLLSDLIIRITLFSRSGSNSKDGGGMIWIALIVIGIILALLTPIIAQIINYTISRKREFVADAGSAEMTRNPLGLASALEKIGKDTEPLEAANKATAHLYIANPLKGQKLWMMNLFQTHPPIAERIAALKGIKA